MKPKTKEADPSCEEKKRLVKEAASEVLEIQLTGQIMRNHIAKEKERMIAEIRESNMQRMDDDAYSSGKRSELIKRMRAAAKVGDFSEVQRIQKLLKEDQLSFGKEMPR